jgi:hypothetical protein
MKINKLIFISLCAFTLAGAAKGPEYRSLKVHGMGGAFVAVADDKNALYYNPAGLNLINRLGNFEKNPDMGYMPRKRFEFNLFSLQGSLPGNTIKKVIDVCGAPKVGTIVKRILFFDFGYFGDAEWCPIYTDIMPDDMKYLPDSLEANTDLAERLTQLDRLPIEIGTQLTFLEFAMHNFAFSAWTNTSAAPYIDLGVIVPYFGYEPVQIDFTVQTAAAFSPAEKWSVGVGFKATNRYKAPKFEFNLEPKIDTASADNNNINIGVKYEQYVDTLEARWENFADDLFSSKNMNYGMDLGVLYQITRTVRLGSSLRNVFFGKLAGESITPNFSIGAMTSPMILQSNSWWGRKVNFAIDYVDIFDGTVGDMFFAHLNFGAEIEQVVVPAIFKIKAGTGFEGGYYAWNLGFALIGDVINMRFGSYAEERGTRTGQHEHRYWTGELSLGF